MIKSLVMALVLSCGSQAMAGGVECQINGTCECQAAGTCDKFGNPKLQNPVIECQDGNNPIRVHLSQPLPTTPTEGQIPAQFENLVLPLHDYVETSINPIFHTLLLRFATAYCGYTLNIDPNEGGAPAILTSYRNCEGTSQKLQCALTE